MVKTAVHGATPLIAPVSLLAFGMKLHRTLRVPALAPALAPALVPALVLAFVSGGATVAGAQYPHTSSAASRPGTGAPATDLPNTGKVVRLIDVPSYTYIEVQLGKKTVWLAAATIKVQKGDVIRFDRGMEMTNFTSSSLKRTFPHILFVSRVVVSREKL